MNLARRSFLPLLLLLALAGAPACTEEFGPGDDTPGDDAPGDDAPSADASATPLPDADPGATDAAGGLAFLAACTSNTECASGLCFNFNAKGLHCTHACQSAADCEAPSPGCSGMNVCKTP